MGAYNDPATKIATVTPSDTTDLSGVNRLRIGGAGDLVVRTIGEPNVTRTIFGVVPGEIVEVRVTRVMAATTATNITALF